MHPTTLSIKSFAIGIGLLLSNQASNAQNIAIGTATNGPNGCGRLTSSAVGPWQSGAIWNSTQRDLTQSFDLTYETFFGCDNGEWGGDGMAFIMHQDPRGTAAIGAGGGFLGFGGNVAERISPSLIVEFDTFNGNAYGGNDIDDDHVAIMRNGDNNDNYVGPVSVPGAELEDCGLWINDFFTVRITWDAPSQTLTAYANGAQLITLTEDIVATYFGGNPNVWWGWTGSTGGATNEQWICPENTNIPWECVSNSCCSDYVLDFVGDTTICNGETKTLSLAGTYETYQWSTGETTASIDITTAGTYSVVVTETQGTFSCPAYDSIQVTLLPDPTPVLNDATICNGETHTLNVGTFVSYDWSDGSNGATTDVTTAGTHGVTVTDANGCTASDNMTLTVNSPGPVTLADQSICPGASLTLDAGAGYTYDWSTGSNAQTIDITTAGQYHVTIEDGNGCTDRDTMTLSHHTLPTVTLNDASICDDQTETLDAGAGFTYNWSTGDNGQTIGATTAGNYSVTITDGNGCTDRDTMNLVVFSTPTVVLNDASVCSGLSVDLDAGVGFTYQWSSGANSQTLSVSTAGAHHVTITDGNGCTDRDTMNLTLLTLPTVTLADVSICEGSSTTIDAGAGFTAYNWSDGSNGQTISVSTAGDYHVTVTNADGCADRDTMALSYFTDPVVTLPAANVCAGTTVTLDAGTGMTTYLWSDASNGQTLDVSSAGDYHVTVTDGNGCTDRDTMTYTVIANPSVTLNDQTVCDQATIDAGAGFAYTWSTGESTQTITPTASGTYHVTITAGTGCSDRDTMNLVVNLSPTVTLADDEICLGETANIDAGAGFNAYVWSDGSSTQQITQAVAGQYSVTVTDVNGCTDRDTMTLVVNPTSPIDLRDQSICADQDLTLDAGAGFDYEWSTGESTQTITINTAGSYHVTITAANNCTDRDTMNLTLLNLPTVTLNDQAICPTDQASLDAGAGLNYQWQDGSNGQTIAVQDIGTYHVTVTNGDGCSDRDTMFLSHNSVPTVTLNDASICPGDNHELSPGAFANYIWSTGEVTSAIAISAEGDYHVTVSNAEGCSDRDTMNLIWFGVPSVALEDSTICVGTSMTLDAGVHSGYNWSTGENTSAIAITTDADYSVTVTDINGCTDRDTMTLSRVTSPAGLVDDIICNATSTAYTVALSVTLGTPGTYEVNGNPLTGNTFTSGLITSGQPYEFIISDAMGCTPDTVRGTRVCDCVTDVGGMDADTLSLCAGETASATYDGLHTFDGDDTLMYVLHTNNGPALGTVIATASATDGPNFNYGGNVLPETIYYISAVAGSDLGGGSVNLTDPCLAVANGTPVIFHEIPEVTVTGDAAFCDGDSSQLTIAFSGIPPFDYTITADENPAVPATTNFTTLTFYGDQNGYYSIVDFTDAHCPGTVLDSAELTVYTLPVLTATSSTPSVCPGDSTLLTATGATVYTWSPDNELNTNMGDLVWLKPDSSTTILVTGVDDNGCADSTAVAVTVLPEVILSASPAEICFGDSAQVSALGADTYHWSPANFLSDTTGNNVWASPSTTSVITVIGNNAGGCADTSTITIIVHDLPSVVVADAAICQGDTAEIAPTGADSYQFLAAGNLTDNGTDAQFYPTTTDSVVVVGTSIQGCTDSAYAAVVVNTPPAIQNLTAICNGTNTAYDVTFDIVGGDIGSYVVTGNGTLTGASFVADPITQGQPYNFTVDDANGCGPDQVGGTRNCNCTTDAGSMTSTDTLRLCNGQAATAAHNGDENLDANDSLIFVLHTNSQAALGSVLDTNDTPDFNYISGLMQPGVVYYISAVTGDKVTGGVDFQDGCLSVSPGRPVLYNVLPSVQISGGGSVCEGDSVPMTALFAGSSPWTYDVMLDNALWLSRSSTTDTVFYANQSGDYTIANIQDANCPGVATGTATVTINALPDSNLVVPDPSVCLGAFATLEVENSQVGVDYTFVSVATGFNLGNALSGTGGTISTNLIPGNDEAFSVFATFGSGCSAWLEDTAYIAVTPPVEDAVFQDINTCFAAGQDTVIVLSNTAAGVTYVMRYDGNNGLVGSPQLSNGSDIAFTVRADSSAVYSLVATDDQGCSSVIPDLGSVTASTPINANASTTDLTCADDCQGIITFAPTGGNGSLSTSLETIGGASITASTADTEYRDLCADQYISTITTTFSGLTCVQVDTFDITQPDALTMSVDSLVDPSCFGQTDGAIYLSVEGGTGTLTVNWSSGQTGTSIEGQSDGNYTAMLTDANNCELVAPLTLTQPDELLLAHDAPAITCSNTPMTIDLQPQGGTAPYSFLWSSGLATQTATMSLTQDTSLSAFVEDVNGCRTTAPPIEIRVYQPLTTDIPDTIFICENSNYSLSPTTAGGLSKYSFVWSNGGVLENTTIDGDGTISQLIVSVTDQCNQLATDTSEVVVFPIPDPQFVIDSTTVCRGTEFILISLNDEVNCSWTFLDESGNLVEQVNTCDSVVTVFAPGQHTLTYAAEQNGCVGDTTFAAFVEDQDTTIADFDYAPIDPNLVFSDINFTNYSYNGQSYLWDFAGLDTSTLSNPRYGFPYDRGDSYDITLWATSQYGCVDSTVQTIVIRDTISFYIPNTFTPNGNGLNDRFGPVMVGTNTVDFFEFFIVDRWGDVIFESFSPTDWWDGRFKNSDWLVKSDVYTWKIVFSAQGESERIRAVGKVTVIE